MVRLGRKINMKERKRRRRGRRRKKKTRGCRSNTTQLLRRNY